MHSNYFIGNQCFEMRSEPVPFPAGKEVLVKVMSCGICGTDVHIYHGEPGSAKVVPPVVLGHEFAGIVEAVGEDVTLFKEGDHVAIDPNIYCGLCRPCRMGKKQNCEHLFALGVNVNGGFAEYALCPETQCFSVNNDIPFDVAAMTEPLACVIHGIDRANILPGQTVLVIGGGAIGQMMVQMARLSGAGIVMLSEPIESRRRIGLLVGADYALNPQENLCEQIASCTSGSGIDVIIECVGTQTAVRQAIQCAGLGTTVLLFSVPRPDTEVSLPLFDVYKKELKILGSIINPDTHQRAVNMINSGKLKISELITHSFGLQNLEAGIHMQMSSESVKVVIHPQE